MANDKAQNNNNDTIRIGVFVCDCGTNIAGVINVPEVVEFAKTLDDVVLVEEGKWICAVDYLSKIKEYITEHNLNRVVVACCTPRTHEPTFKETVKEAGLNPFLLEFVSIREQSSWVHKDTPELATDKAKDLVRMGVAKARFLEPGEEIRIPVGKECLVIGGGIAGMTAALALGDLGFKVSLVEKSKALGGTLSRLNKIAPEDVAAKDVLQPKLERVQNHENITVFTSTEVADVNGYVGNFNVTLKQNQNSESANENQKVDEFKVSTIIVATGMTELEPVGQFGYGKFPSVLTQLQFEELLKNDNDKLAHAKDIAFINCVGSRNAERGCCNVGCMSAIKNIKTAKEINNDINAYLFFRDFNITGMDVQYHYNSMDKYAAAFRYPDDSPPIVQGLGSNRSQDVQEGQKLENNNRLTIQCYDIHTGQDVKVEADLIVLTTGFKGDPSVDHLKGLLKVSTNPDGFFHEAHVKLRPLDFPNEGIYVCGCARSPKNIRETLDECIGAAMRAAIPMKKSYVETEGVVANIDAEECISCRLCADACAFEAIELVDNKSQVIQAICKGCGICAASCPQETINIVHYSDEQILAQVDAALFDKPENKIIAFACHWCALGAVDNAGVSRFEYPPNIRIIRVMCSGRVDPRFILQAFERGAAGVLVAGCEFPTCHYMSGNYYATKKVQLTRKLLELSGISQDRLRLEWLSAAEGPKFAKITTEFDKTLGALGPLKNDGFSELDFQAAIDCASGTRLRIIATKLKEFVDIGNKYGEVFTSHEVDRLLDEVVDDEFIANKILLLTQETSKSVKALAEELGESPNKIFKCILDLIPDGKVKLDKLDGLSPQYCTVPGSDLGTSPNVNTESNSQEKISPEPPINLKTPEYNKEFDHIIIGTTTSALNQALKLAESGDKICLISRYNSFSDNPPILSEEFSKFTDYLDGYRDLVDLVHKNNNITIFRNTEIEKVIQASSNPGIKLELHKNATFIDETKCDNCGKCIEACPVKLIDFDSFGLSNKRAIYQPNPKTENLKYAISKGIPYCQASCPIEMDVRGYIGKIADTDIHGASSVIRSTNPLPDICGKVCTKACESTCVRSYLDESLEIRKLKRFSMEDEYYQLDSDGRPILTKPTILKNHDIGNKIAIIGSGPAGLAAAHDLARLGYPVTIFEALSQPGGMMSVGIPDFRLPTAALDKEINAILNLGVELKLNTPLGVDLTIEDLKAQGYKAIFLAVGAHKSLRLGVEGEEKNGVSDGLRFLKECNQPGPDGLPKIGNKIIVIGGGNVAIDCARTARRLGAENVQILYRRSKSEMPAEPEEIQQCEAEGVSIDYLVTPKRILGSKKVTSIECLRTELGAPDDSGRRRPVPIDGSEFNIDADTILTAIGQEPDLKFLNQTDNFDLTPRATFIVNEQTGATNVEGVFAGGDAVSGPTTIINAIKAGKAAAKGIDEFLSGNLDNNLNVYEFKGEKRGSDLELMRTRKNKLETQSIPIHHRSPEKLLDTTNRITNFDEVDQPFSSEEAIGEAKRCLSCRMCIGCGVCQAVCPQNAIDYNMVDEELVVEAKEVIDHQELIEGRFNFDTNLQELYRNSVNVISPMELEYMLMPDGLFNGQPLRPYDGEVPRNIAFINLPIKESITEQDTKLNNLELLYNLKLMKYLTENQKGIELKLYTNSMDLEELPDDFQYLKKNISLAQNLKAKIEIISEDSIEINEKDETKTFELKVNGKTINFDLVVLSLGLKRRLS